MKNKEKCIYCQGTGVVSAFGKVFANEPHMADVEEAPCPECTNLNEK